jgi:hypothetical protein
MVFGSSNQKPSSKKRPQLQDSSFSPIIPAFLNIPKSHQPQQHNCFSFLFLKKNTKEKRRNLLVELGQSQKKKIPSPHFTLLKKNSGKERGDIKRQ